MSKLLRRFGYLFRRREFESEMEEELRFHLDMKTEANREAGMSPAEARYKALRHFGNTTMLQEQSREVWIFAFLHSLAQDLRYAARVLRKSPGFTIVAILTLAIGIGANSAIFSVVNSVLLRPLPFPNADRVVLVMATNKKGLGTFGASAPNYIDWRDQNHVFEQMAALGFTSFNMSGVGAPELLPGRRFSAGYLAILGARPALGRSFTPEEEQPGHDDVVMISNGCWKGRFGGAPDIVGRNVVLNSNSFRIIGVLPESFRVFGDVEIFAPCVFEKKHFVRDWWTFGAAALLKPGVSLEQAQAEMRTIANRLEQQYPATNTDQTITLVPLPEAAVRGSRQLLLIALGAVTFVMLIACANVASLLLARASARHREFAIRAALGSGRRRLARQLLTESALLFLTGGALGFLLARLGVDLLITLAKRYINRADEVSLDARVLGFTVLVSLITGVLFGLAPAIQGSRANLSDALKDSSRSLAGGVRRNRVRSVLVVCELALAVVLLVGAGLLTQSFLRVRSVSPGFDPENVLVTSANLPESKYPTHGQRVAFYQNVLDRLKDMPGVESAGLTTAMPTTGYYSMFFAIEGRPVPEGKEPITGTLMVSADYFRTVKIPLVRGRVFTDRDLENAPLVAVINQAMANRYFPNQDPIGKRVRMEDTRTTWREIVGVVADVRQGGLEREPNVLIYRPFQQKNMYQLTVAVRTQPSEASRVAANLRSRIQDVDKDQPWSRVQPMGEIVALSVSPRRFNMILLGVFAAVALLLAAIGVYGVMSYFVTQRTHEVGIRIALGARTGAVLRLILGQSMLLTAAGLFAGLAAALGLSRFLASMLYGVTATNAGTYASVAFLLGTVALLSSFLPARRATRVDPMTALRHE